MPIDYGSWTALANAPTTFMDAMYRAQDRKRQQQREDIQNQMLEDQAKQSRFMASPSGMLMSDIVPGAPMHKSPAGPSATGEPMGETNFAPNSVALDHAMKVLGIKAMQQKQDQLKMLPTTGINMQDLSSLPVDLKALESLAAEMDANKNIVGPWAGRMAKGASFLPTALQSADVVKMQDLQSKVDNLKQTIGKFKEGGVLRKEDEEKYNRILATIWDNPAVAAQKLKSIHAEMGNKYNATLNTLGAQGYKTAGLNQIPVGGVEPSKIERAKMALADPEATPQEKAAAQRILGGK